MVSFPLIITFVSVTLIWLGVLTFLVVKTRAHYNNLIKGVNQKNLEKVLNGKELAEIKATISRIQKQDLGHIQKIGFVRFNPFNETGGDNSFALSLMDGEFNGIVITGLHTREKTRMYAKEIRKGMSRYELSKEERKAIQEAVK